jgi:hypothetical protein
LTVAVLPAAAQAQFFIRSPKTPAAELPPGACSMIADASELELGVTGPAFQASCQQQADKGREAVSSQQEIDKKGNILLCCAIGRHADQRCFARKISCKISG